MAREGEGVSRVMRRVVEGHRTCEADAINQDGTEQNGDHSWKKDGCSAVPGLGGSCERANHGQPQLQFWILHP